MSETTVFPLPIDATDEERRTAREQIGGHATIRSEDARGITFDGRTIGQTGPIWHFQYTRMYALPKGYLVAAHDLREGIKVGYAETAEKLPEVFEDERVREFLEDELRFRKVIGAEHAASV